MNHSEIVELAEQLRTGHLNVNQFVQRCAQSITADIGDVQLDLDRARRCGYPEVVYAEGKAIDTIKQITARLRDNDQPVLVTRLSEEQAHEMMLDFPAGHYNAIARTFRMDCPKSGPSDRVGQVAIVTAGTSDQPVAEEARETLEWMNDDVCLVHDVGVAGPHRLPAHLDKLENADAIVVVAGMEGALPSVVGGYVSCPVIGVPTSVGYGASFSGFAALLAMLNSCAANVTVVNIDAGFKAGYVAGLIASRSR